MHKRIIQYFVRLWEGRWKRDHLGEPNHDEYVQSHVEIELKQYKLDHPEAESEVCVGGRRWNQL